MTLFMLVKGDRLALGRHVGLPLWGTAPLIRDKSIEDDMQKGF
jgi:hypothetical protein